MQSKIIKTLILPYITIDCIAGIVAGSVTNFNQLPDYAHDFTTNSGRVHRIYFKVRPGSDTTSEFDKEFIQKNMVEALFNFVDGSSLIDNERIYFPESPITDDSNVTSAVWFGMLDGEKEQHNRKEFFSLRGLQQMADRMVFCATRLPLDRGDKDVLSSVYFFPEKKSGKGAYPIAKVVYRTPGFAEDLTAYVYQGSLEGKNRLRSTDTTLRGMYIVRNHTGEENHSQPTDLNITTFARNNETITIVYEFSDKDMKNWFTEAMLTRMVDDDLSNQLEALNALFLAQNNK